MHIKQTNSHVLLIHTAYSPHIHVVFNQVSSDPKSKRQCDQWATSGVQHFWLLNEWFSNRTVQYDQCHCLVFMHVTDFLKHLKQNLQETVDHFPKASVLS